LPVEGLPDDIYGTTEYEGSAWMEVRHIEKSREALCRFWIEVTYGRESEWSINVDKEGGDLKGSD
jgi:hypothetical protein